MKNFIVDIIANAPIFKKIAAFVVVFSAVIFFDSLFLRAQVSERDSLQAAPKVAIDSLSYSDSVDFRMPSFALKTNLLYDIAATPNVSVEFPLGNGRFSMGLNYEFPWWVWDSNSRCWQILHLEAFTRLWLGKVTRAKSLVGPYVGLVGGAGYYDIEPKHSGWQGEAVNAGLELGWAWNLGKKNRWRLEAGVGAGWMITRYRRYQGTSDDVRLIRQYDGRYQWIGPVKAEIGLSYIIFKKDRRAEAKDRRNTR